MRVIAIMSHDRESPAVAELASQAEVVCVGPVSDASGAIDHALALRAPGPLARRIEEVAWRSAIGRNVIRITPLDRSRRLWRAAKRDRGLQDLVRSADIVVALDRDAVLTVWKLAHDSRLDGSWDAVYGGAAALFAINSRAS